MDRIEIAIVGAGVVGLAVALELSKKYKDVFVLEKEDSFGRGTSSRNSEVIHAGIYYPKDSLKTKTCVEGRKLLYDFCKENKIRYQKIGKLILAVNQEEVAGLCDIYQHGHENGVHDLEMLSEGEVSELEPNVKAEMGILSPSTGIVDSHGLMNSLATQFKANGGDFLYKTEVVGVEKVAGGYKIAAKEKIGETYEFFSRIFINAAGLDSDKVAGLIGLDLPEYKLKYSKGNYVRVCPSRAGCIKRLIYPVPKKNGAGLGIHATFDLAGGLRLGPDDDYVEKVNYDKDASKEKLFHESVRSFLPFIRQEDLSWDMAGVRPKLQGQGEPFRDFVIKSESGNGLHGFINLIGIESPGLTASLSIAQRVRKLVETT